MTVALKKAPTGMGGQDQQFRASKRQAWRCSYCSGWSCAAWAKFRHIWWQRRFLEVVPPKGLRKQRISLPLVQKDIISLGSEAANKRQKVTSQMWSLSKKLFMWTQMRVRMTRMEGGIILTLLMSHMSGHLLRRLTPLWSWYLGSCWQKDKLLQDYPQPMLLI